METLTQTAAWLGLLIGGLPALYVFVLTLAALLPLPSGRQQEPYRRIAAVIPAHNESLLISATVRALMEQDYPNEAFAVLVIADNCTDDTADKARAAGARVLERTGDPGKGQGLYDAFALLMKEDWDAFLVVDADSHTDPGALRAIHENLEDGAKAMQLLYGILNPNDSIRTQAMQLGLSSFNGLRPRGRTVLGLSSGIFGNGFCLSREALQKVPYLAHSIVEDIEYHTLLVKAGYKVRFIDRAGVRAQMPVTAKASEVQRVRWEIGRGKTIRNYAPALFREALKGKAAAADALLDIFMPPMSLLALALTLALVLGDNLVRMLALGAIGLLGLHYLVSSWRYGNPLTLIKVALFVPWYVIWKTYIVGKSIASAKDLPWVRTDRHE